MKYDDIMHANFLLLTYAILCFLLLFSVFVCNLCLICILNLLEVKAMIILFSFTLKKTCVVCLFL